MNRIVILIIVLLLLPFDSIGQNWSKFAIPLGEKNLNSAITEIDNNCRIVTIRIDADGNLYPNKFISDKSFKKSGGTLKKWYNRNALTYAEILQLNHLNSDGTIEDLNACITQNFVHNIDSLAVDRDIIFLIHGYRKSMYAVKDNTTSMSDNERVRKCLGSNKVIIEVYWDSRHITVKKGIWRLRGLTMLSESSTPNAKNVGKRLKLLIDKIQQKRINVISHSLGSIVSNFISFNFEKNESRMNGKELLTIYLAPAIGYESFSTYHQRGISENYTLKTIIGFNRNDWVLKKEFSKWINSSATTYGNTSLGCDWKNDIQKLITLFKTQMPTEKVPEIINMGEIRSHHFFYYFEHQKFKNIISTIEK